MASVNKVSRLNTKWKTFSFRNKNYHIASSLETLRLDYFGAAV